jgi:uncharacterized membrane protein
MSVIERIRIWFGAVLGVTLVAVVLSRLFRRFPDSAHLIPTSILQATLYLLVPSGIGVLYYVFKDDF